MREKRSIIWKEASDIFEAKLREYGSVAGVLRSYGMAVSGGSHKIVVARIHKEQLQHLLRKTPRVFPTTTPINSILIENGTTRSYSLKRRLLKEGLIMYRCVHCGNEGSWSGKPLALHLDHINGISSDNRIENLRILCPNCHSQTSTYSGKHKGQKYFCVSCGKRVASKLSKKCLGCSNSESKCRRFEISKEELCKLVWLKPTQQIAKDFGVSDTAVSKRCKRLGVEKPGRGYWTKINRSK